MVQRFAWVAMIITFMLFFSVAKVSASGETYFNFWTGYRNDGLRWNIAGNLNGGDPNILSELTWTELKIHEFVAEIRVDLSRNLFLQSSLGYGSIGKGQSQDSDYDNDNRSSEFSRSNNQSNGDNVWDGSISLGFRLVTTPDWGLIFLTGYSWNMQNLRMTDGYQTIPDMGAFSGLNSTYKSSWKGPWIGVYAANRFRRNWRLFGNAEYHWADYYGEGNWNLRDDLVHPVSFIHQAEGMGLVTMIGIEFFAPEWLAGLSIQKAGWSAGNGLDQVFSTNGMTGVTRLNEVVWNSMVITFKVKYLF